MRRGGVVGPLLAVAVVLAAAAVALEFRIIPRPVWASAKAGMKESIMGFTAAGLDRDFLDRYAEGFSASYLRAGWHGVPRTCIVARKSAFRLDLRTEGRLHKGYRMGIGKKDGAVKIKYRDDITPEGIFWVTRKVEDPIGFWGPAGKGYGPRVLSLAGPGASGKGWEMAIHGIPPGAEWTIGKKRSHGCLRLLDRDIIELYNAVDVGDLVFIAP